MRTIYPNRKVASHVDDSVSTEIELMNKCGITTITVAQNKVVTKWFEAVKKPKVEAPVDEYTITGAILTIILNGAEILDVDEMS